MKQKNYEELDFTDDFMFCKIMYDNEEICKEIVELILGCKINHIEYPEKQKTIEITSDGKGIRLDVYLEDGKTVYDIEMQTTVNLDLGKRARYYQGMIDLNLINRGEPFSKLKEAFVVFICLDDLFEVNRSIYTFKNLCLEDNDIYLNDGSTKVFVNANGSRNGLTSAQSAFLDYVAGKAPSDNLTQRLNDMVIYARAKEQWRTEYMTLLQRDREKYEEGLAEGRAEGSVNTLLNLVKDGLLDINEAAKRANLTIEEFKAAISKTK